MFGALVLLVGTVASALLTGEAWLTVLFGGGFACACVNVYWVGRRLRYERPRP
ncbi:hypothetical protein ACIBFB_07705 [Nocardiopsis sp. NPDC050513]|uniref:hypothetical protein n=1 Tax=Nocardiopsis sp. NPDC050513 TaxID=3364338 RepID=UPI0037AF2E1A